MSPNDAALALRHAFTRLGATLESTFVPYTCSRYATTLAWPRDRSLNWRVTVSHQNRPLFTMDYSESMGYAPSYPDDHDFTALVNERLAYEAEHGRHATRKTPLTPITSHILYTLITDCDVLNYTDFAAWAADFGYNDDRTARAVYQMRLTHARSLRAAIGDAGLAELTAYTKAM